MKNPNPKKITDPTVAITAINKELKGFDKQFEVLTKGFSSVVKSFDTVAKKIDTALESAKRPSRVLQVPVYQYQVM